AAAMWRPSGLKATPDVPALTGISGLTGWPEAASHTRTEATLAATKRRPSGANATWGKEWAGRGGVSTGRAVWRQYALMGQRAAASASAFPGSRTSGSANHRRPA